MKVIIVGGSVSGLMHGVMLKHNGHAVHILERTSRDLEAQGAGVSTSDEVTSFLKAHDRLSAIPLSLPSDDVRIYDPSSRLTGTMVLGRMQMCTWDAMYYRLRANFDGLATAYCPEPPADRPGDGEAVYDMGKEVVGIEEDRRDGRVIVRYRDKLSKDGGGEDGTGEEEATMAADIVIAADGASSTVKSLLAPHAPPRQYAGYVAWRGIIPETAVSAATRSLLMGSYTFHTGAGEYAVVYPIPGRSGSLAEGSRALNFVWYAWRSAAALADALTDADGRTHRWSVPSGRLRPEVWARQREHGVAHLSKEFAEILRATDMPFLQLVSDCRAPSHPGPALLGGKVVLVGDAQCVIRPHTGFALNQAARHCRELERRLPRIERALSAEEEERMRRRREGGGGAGGDAGNKAAGRSDVAARMPGGGGGGGGRGIDCMADWSDAVLDFGHVVRLRSIAVGMLYLKTRLRWLPALLRWKGAEAWLSLKTRWRGIFG